MRRGTVISIGVSKTHGTSSVVVRALVAVVLLIGSLGAFGQENPPERVVDLPRGGTANSSTDVKAPAGPSGPGFSLPNVPDLSKRENLSGAMQLIILLT